MAYEFERFTARVTPTRWPHPRITIHRTGTMGLNRRAFELLGEPAAVAFLFDRRRRVIGLEPASADAADAYRIIKKAGSESYVVRAARFLEHYGIAPQQPLVWGHVQVHEGIVVLDLDHAIILRKERSAKSQLDGRVLSQ